MTPSRRSGLLDAIDETTLGQVITNFSERMMSDERLGRFFAGVNLPMLRAHQRSFLLAALSGPELFNELTLATSHLPLGLDDDDFDRAIGHLTGGMVDAGVSPAAIAPIAGRLEPLRVHIVAGNVRHRAS
jgi:hemoglobin